MQEMTDNGQVQTLIQELFIPPVIKEDSKIISLTSNELASISLQVSSYIRKGFPINELLENTVKVLGEAGIAERILLFQINDETTKASLINQWESPYMSKINLADLELDLRDIPLFKFFRLNSGHSLQIEDFSRYLVLPNYLFRNKFKALFIKLKTKSLLATTGSAQKVKLVLNLQFNTREVIWSNEIEKVMQSIIDQLVIAIDQSSNKKKTEDLQKNIIQLQERAIKEQEALLRQFASDVHDLPCSIIPNLKQAIREKDFIECERLVDELHNNLRQLINEYVVPDINLLGFGSVMYQFINGFKKSFKGNVYVDIPDEEINISNKKGIELFKVIKECFCNIEKHSKASDVVCRLQKMSSDFILITISDNGKGFDVSDTRNLGYGLLNIQHRLSEINSKFEIKSEINKGTTLSIQVCLP